jgi:formylglycine-generating enzyme required for sulfatase activity
VIPAGSFWMGSPDGSCPADYPAGEGCGAEPWRQGDETLHHVTLSRDFEMMRTEVTQGDFVDRMGWNPSAFGPNGPASPCGLDCPVETVSWWDAVAYANALSQDAGLAPCFELTDIVCEDGTPVGNDPLGCMNVTQAGIESASLALAGVQSPYDCEGYRLPTESEWEYAIRAGELTPFHTSPGNDGSITVEGLRPIEPNLDQIAWYGGNNTPWGTKDVGTKEPNAHGLYDMSGEIWEWGWDWYEPYPAGDTANTVLDPEGAAAPTIGRVSRGCSWANAAWRCRSAFRSYAPPGARGDGFMGFRLVRTL